jgi:hypothetical protein
MDADFSAGTGFAEQANKKTITKKIPENEIILLTLILPYDIVYFYCLPGIKYLFLLSLLSNPECNRNQIRNIKMAKTGNGGKAGICISE